MAEPKPVESHKSDEVAATLAGIGNRVGYLIDRLAELRERKPKPAPKSDA